MSLKAAGGAVICSGTILTPTKVLTLAHCVASHTNTPLTVVAGDPSVRTSEKQAAKVHIHPKFAGFLYFDIAVINLDSPLVFDDLVGPVCLPRMSEMSEMSKEDETGLLLSVAGHSGSVHNVMASVYSERLCDLTHRENAGDLPDMFTDTVLCAGHPGGKSGTCSEESGNI